MSKNQQNNQQKNQKRRKWPWVIFVILVVLAVGIAILAKWQWNNIVAIHYATKYTPEQLSQLQAENEAALQEICEEVSVVDITRLPEEAQKQLQTGELSAEDAVGILVGELQWDQETKTVKPVETAGIQEESSENGPSLESGDGKQSIEGTQSTNPKQPNDDKKTVDTEEPINTNPSEDTKQPDHNDSGKTSSEQQVSRVDEIIAQIYVLRSSYVGQLDGLVMQGWREYKRGEISKQGAISKYVGIGTGLEGQCDSQIETLLSELHTELVRTDGDVGLIDQIRYTYQSQKSIKKAEMIAKYQ